MKPLLTLAVFASLAGIGSAASPIVQTHVIDPYTASGSATVTFDQFDTQGGTRTLTGVTLTFSFDKLGGSYAVDNDSTNSGSVTFRHRLEGALSSSDVTVGTAETYVSALSQFTTSIGSDDGDPQNQFDVGGSDYAIYTPANILGTSGGGAIAEAFWGAYTGTGTFDVTFDAIQSFATTGVGGLQSQTIASQVAPTVQVTYTYTPTAVPEPVSPLLGGLGMLLLFRRRR